MTYILSLSLPHTHAKTERAKTERVIVYMQRRVELTLAQKPNDIHPISSPYILNPKPQALNPQPSTLNFHPKAQDQNPISSRERLVFIGTCLVTTTHHGLPCDAEGLKMKSKLKDETSKPQVIMRNEMLRFANRHLVWTLSLSLIHARTNGEGDSVTCRCVC